MNSFTLAWEQALGILERDFAEKNISLAFDTYIRPLTPEFEDDNVFFFRVANDYYKNQLQQRFIGEIRDALDEARRIAGFPPSKDIVFATTDEMDTLLLAHRQSAPVRTTISLNPNFRFDTFVVGSSNRMAHSAAAVVADSPGAAYNPLFIYGGVGLGKTHLMHAIGNAVLDKNPGARIVYVTSEEFINGYIESIRKDAMESFRSKFRSVDMLLIDDIQFISNKLETQMELFHTFNTLQSMGKQIIFSSDKPPAEIPKIEERLSSRFTSGLVVDIALPDYETRVAILRSKAPIIKDRVHCTFDISDEVLHYIASKENTNIRDLEGALQAVIARAKLMSMDSDISVIDKDTAVPALRSFFTEPEVRAVSASVIIAKVCEYYDITEADILSKNKSRSIAFPRQIAMYLLKTLTNMTNEKVGECVKITDHSTVIYAVRKITKEQKTDPEVKNAVNDIIKMIRG